MNGISLTCAKRLGHFVRLFFADRVSLSIGEQQQVCPSVGAVPVKSREAFVDLVSVGKRLAGCGSGEVYSLEKKTLHPHSYFARTPLPCVLPLVVFLDFLWFLCLFCSLCRIVVVALCCCVVSMC